MPEVRPNVSAVRLRVGVIGAGTMGKHHVRAYKALRDVDLVGVADPDQDARRAVRELHDVPTFADHRQLLGLVDAVSVAVPTTQHLDVALECLAARLHILVEKPIASDSDQGERIIAAARSAGRILQVGHIERFNPAVAELVRLIRGEQLLAISAQRLSPPTPRITDVDVVFDLMIHDIDVALSIADAESFADLAAIGRPVRPAPLDHVVAHGRTRTGVLIRLEASKITHHTVRELDVTTDRSYIRVNYLNRDIAVHRGAAVTTVPAPGYAYVEQGSITRPHVPMVEPLVLELEHFVDCISSGQRPVTSGESAVASLRIAERIQSLAWASRA